MVNIDSYDNRDQILPDNYGDFHTIGEFYRVDSTKGMSGNLPVGGIGKPTIAGYPLPSYDTWSERDGNLSVVATQHDPLSKISVSALPITGGVQVFAGLNQHGDPVVGVREPQDVLEVSPLALLSRRDPMHTKELEELQLARTGSQVEPGSAGFLMVLGRLVLVPIDRMAHFMRLWAARAIDRTILPIYDVLVRWAVVTYQRVVLPVWAPTERAIIRMLDWLDRQIKKAEPYVVRATQFFVTSVKKVLDFLIVDLPRAVLGAIVRFWDRLSR